MLPRRLASALLPLPWLLPWTGCAPVPPPLVVPPTLLACLPAPAVPDAPDDPALARWVLDLAEAGEDCRARLARVREIVTP